MFRAIRKVAIIDIQLSTIFHYYIVSTWYSGLLIDVVLCIWLHRHVAIYIAPFKN